MNNRRKKWRSLAAVCLACALGFVGCKAEDGGKEAASEALSGSMKEETGNSGEMASDAGTDTGKRARGS